MAAAKGNQLWRLRTTHGRPRIFETAEELWQACCEYFEWALDNPLVEDRIISYQGDAKHIDVKRMRIMTYEGLTTFLGIHRSTWNDWREVDDFSDVIRTVDGIIKEQQLAGAASDQLNHHIVARYLGLKENLDLSSEDGSMTPPKRIERVIIDPVSGKTETIDETGDSSND